MATGGSTFWAEFDSPVSGTDDIEVVFDHNQGRTCIA
jgi:hypothetical protein